MSKTAAIHTASFQIRLPQVLKDRMDALVKGSSLGESISSFIRYALLMEVERREKEARKAQPKVVATKEDDNAGQ